MASFFVGVVKSVLVRLIVLAVVLTAGYFLVAKPLLDETTGPDGALGSGPSALIESLGEALGEDGVGGIFGSRSASRLLNQVRSAVGSGELDRADLRRLQRCVDRAETRAQARRCAQRATR